jgi:hypothetical protein
VFVAATVRLMKLAPVKWLAKYRMLLYLKALAHS